MCNTVRTRVRNTVRDSVAVIKGKKFVVVSVDLKRVIDHIRVRQLRRHRLCHYIEFKQHYSQIVRR